ncbi:MAG: hypothetical protein M1573_02420 [Candidatus Parvarchaeota archaeon]|jgi:polysaccharide pyruvyl transferase WcaK-like protein|nr:hypothetical protein [Candidatus Parvarchaeota archaeon]MCL5018069.1 hypothetical protein [Candidatus Parvarchaeota archaeon]
MQNNKTSFEILRDRVLHNPFLYILAGILVGIGVARLYVFLGGNLNVQYDGIVFHHFFLGMLLVIVVGALVFLFYEKFSRSRRFRDFMALLFGFGVGLIVDEANFLVSTARLYSLSQYYSADNIYAEFGTLAVFAVIFFISLLVERKR